MVFLLAWWAAALILAVLPFEGAPRIAVFAAIFAILACALLWYLFKRYKNFKLSKLFAKNPNLSLLLFAVENLLLGAFCVSFLACLAEGYFWGEQAASWSAPFAFAFVPFLPDRFCNFICLTKREAKPMRLSRPPNFISRATRVRVRNLPALKSVKFRRGQNFANG